MKVDKKEGSNGMQRRATGGGMTARCAVAGRAACLRHEEGTPLTNGSDKPKLQPPRNPERGRISTSRWTSGP